MKNLKMMKLKRNRLLLLTLLASSHIFAQQFTAKAKLSTIKEDGMHSIAISPEVRSFSKIDLSDIRIFDANNLEVPYYVFQDSRETSTINFEGFPIISKEIVPNKSSIIVVENKGSQVIDEVILNISNSKLSKRCNISGSNDKNQWFGLLDKYNLGDLENTTSTDVFVNISLPLSSYRYLKFQIDDTNSAPINLLKIGGFKHSSFSSQLILIQPDNIDFKNIKSEKKTQITVSFNDRQVLDNIDFKISKPNFFKRSARILIVRTLENEKNKEERYLETLIEFELNSNGENTFKLPSIFEKEIIIEIDNQDNQALEFEHINFGQLPIYLVADLKANEKYILKTGDATLSSPSYDIDNFKINGTSSLPVATVSDLELIPIESESSVEEKSFWQQKWFLWLCIGIAGIALVYFTSSLLKDMKK